MSKNRVFRLNCRILFEGKEINFHITHKNESTLSTASTFLNSGSSFLLAGERCRVDEDNGNGGVTSLTIPSLVNYMFSIELFLKGICKIEGVDYPYEHKIKSIYKKISQDNKTALSTAFDNNWRSFQPIFIKLSEANKKQDYTPEIKEIFRSNIDTLASLNFNKLIDIVDNYFVDLRYALENRNRMDYLDLPILVLAQSTHDVLKKLTSN